MSEWLNAITDLRKSRAEKPPAGFKTREQIQVEIGVGRSRASEMLVSMENAGIAERREFLIEVRGVIRAVPHYRLKKQGRPQRESRGR